jgi:hypothetical protein
MTAARRSGAATGIGRLVPWALVVAGFVVVALLAGAPGDGGGEPFDPSSTAPNGTRALVELIGAMGAEVEVGRAVPAAEDDVAILFTDTLDEQAVGEVEAWVRGGGSLVVADPFSAFTPPLAAQIGAFGVTPSLDRGRCDVAALADLDRIEPGRAVTLEVGPSHRSCFGQEAAAYVVESTSGVGTIAALGGGELFTNAHLGGADNAPLAARLLVPEPGVRVAVLQPSDGDGTADRSLSDVMSTGVRLALVQLVVAFFVYAWFRARRLGPPVIESQPVEIAGSELVVAVGQLLQQSKDPDRAARLLRADLRRRVGERLGLPATTPPDVVADVIVARTALDQATVRQAVTDIPIQDDRALLELARTVDAVRQEVLHDH